MRNAKLWSVLCAAVLLCACVVGVLFTGASASDSRIPEATVTYVVGTDGNTIRACLEKAAEETWSATDVLEIQFTGSDSSAYSKPDAANGVSGYTLFEVTTIFREDDTKLPIVIRGMDADRGAKIMTAENDYSATNDYYFTNLTVNGGNGVKVKFYAGCGKLVFENTRHNNFLNTYYFGDNMSMDVYEGWNAAKVAANSNEDGLIETGITFGNGCTGLFSPTSKTETSPYYTNDTTQRFSAVGYEGDANTNGVILSYKRSSVTAALTEQELAEVKAAALVATYKPGNVLTDCIVKPWDTSAHLVIDLGTVATAESIVPDFGHCGARKGVSPVRVAKVEVISGGVSYLSAGGHNSSWNETFVGDTYVIMRGGRSGNKTTADGYTQYGDVGIRLSHKAMFVGDLTLEIHEDDPAVPTWTPWIQTSQEAAASTVFGDYHFLMTGGTIGTGASGNDGYWGAPVATGSTVNEVQGGKIWAFYGSRYTNSYENTTVSTVLPGTGETLTAKVTVHNKISGGEIGGLVNDAISTSKGFVGQTKGSNKLASVCNEISGGTIYYFNSGNSTTSAAPGDVYNFVYGTQEKYPTFLSHFYGAGSTVTTENVTNVIKGYPVFQNKAGEKLSIFGACKNGTVNNVVNYLGGMPVFDDFYGGCSGRAPGSKETDADARGVVGTIVNTIALDMTETAISNYVWGGNGYHTIEGVNGATDTKGNSENRVTGSITCNIYSGHFGTFRAESACGKIDNVPLTTNVYGGKWTSNFMTANRGLGRTNTAGEDSVVTTNIYDGTFNGILYMAGQNANNREFVNNVYGGTFTKNYYGGGQVWVKKVTNNVYGGTFSLGWYGGCYEGGAETIVNNIYGGQFSASRDYLGCHSMPESESNLCATTIENNLYGGHFGGGWTYLGHNNGPVSTITNHFYSGEDNPCRDPENELYKYYNASTMLEGGIAFSDQVVCGSGYTESYVNKNTADAIVNTFEGGVFTKAQGAGNNITLHGGMRWGVVGNVTNNFVKGTYYRYYGGCDYGYVTGTVTNNFGKVLEEGEDAPTLVFTDYLAGGGLDQSNDGLSLNEKIVAAKAAAEPTAAQQAWITMAETYGDDFNGGAKYIVNNVYYGTYHQFYGGSYGSTSGTAASKSSIDTITNNIYGGTFDKRGTESTIYAGGCFRNAVITTGITNNVEGGVFNGSWYAGSIGTGKVSCPSIVNNIESFTGNKSANAYVYLGNGAPTYNGTVKTVINDFDAGKSYVMGGSTNVHIQPEGVEYGIETTINGGTFCGFWGLGGGTSCEYTGNVKTTVNGGTFNGYAANMPNSLMGGPRNGTLVGDVELIINDGTFTADVVGGTIWGSQDAACDTITGNVTTTIKGGDFQRNIYALSRHPAEDLKATGTVAVNVEQTAGVALKLGGKAIIDSFTSNEETVDITADTNLEIKALTGKLFVHQTEGWQAHVYLALPVNTEHVITEAEGIYGGYLDESDETGVFIVGADVVPAGATLRLAERLGIRVLFDKEIVEPYGDAFTYEVTFKEKVIKKGGKADLEVYGDAYYSIVFDGIGLSDFGTYVSISGPCMKEALLSVKGLAEDAQIAWADNATWKAYADAILEFHNVYNNDAANTMTPDAVALVPKPKKGEADGIVTANATLLMGDAAGLRLIVTLDAAPVNAKILVNGNEITQLVKVADAIVTADLYFAHEYLADEFVVSVVSDAGVHMTYTASIEAIAAQLAGDDTNTNKNNATAFLVYIQKAVACK